VDVTSLLQSERRGRIRTKEILREIAINVVQEESQHYEQYINKIRYVHFEETTGKNRVTHEEELFKYVHLLMDLAPTTMKAIYNHVGGNGLPLHRSLGARSAGTAC